ncbi:MAG: hypothetical protein AB1489_14755, partial [Acidobacteriota bacterium]
LTSIRDKPAGRNIFSLASNCQEWNEITSRVVKRRHSKLLSMKDKFMMISLNYAARSGLYTLLLTVLGNYLPS